MLAGLLVILRLHLAHNSITVRFRQPHRCAHTPTGIGVLLFMITPHLSSSSLDNSKRLLLFFTHELPDMQHRMSEFWKAPQWPETVSLPSMRKNLH